MRTSVKRARLDVQPKLLYTPEEAAELLSISRTRLYSLLGRTVILSVKEGRQRLIPAIALEHYVRRRIREQCQTDLQISMSGTKGVSLEA